MQIEGFWPPSLSRECRMYEELIALTEIYEDFKEKSDVWSHVTDFNCPYGCGTCCSKFHPDILPVEANLVALYLLKETSLIQILESSSPDQKFCPFYAPGPDKRCHCGIYEVRPLICRLFGYSTTTDKNGTAIFSLCKEMPNPGPRVYTEEELKKIFSQLPPSRGLYGSRISCIQPQKTTRLLREAVLESVAHIRMLLSFTGQA